MLSKKTLILSILLTVSFLRPSAQVTLQTGSAVFSLPIFNWQDDKSRLTSVVALSYNSGNGLKVNDVASNVGQGWNLVAGGVITRMQMGEPDDQIAYAGTAAYGNGSDQDVTKYPAGFLYDTIPVERGCPRWLTLYPTYGSKNNLYAQHNTTAQDKQQDYFAFQFNGKSGRFVIDTAGGWHGVLLGDSKMKISITVDPSMTSQGIRTTITAFTITDVDGLIYKFTQHGLTKLLKQVFSSHDGKNIQGEPKIGNTGVYCQSGFDVGPASAPWANQYMANPYIISNWYLTEVDDPFVSTRVVTINYNPALNLANDAGADISYNKSLDNYVIVSYKKSVTRVLEVASITYPDGHLVSFNYAPNYRYDYPGQKALASVDISYSGRFLSECQLGTSYLIFNHYGTPSSAAEVAAARLCLMSIRKIGVDLKEDSPPYTFDYYKGSSAADDFVPPPFFYAKDIWGYYNGYNSTASNVAPGGTSFDLKASKPFDLGFYALKGLCFQNDNVTGTFYNAKVGYAQNGLLKQIVYPTGGSLTYQYAQNTGVFADDLTGTVRNVGGVHVSQTSSSDGGYSNGCATPIVTQYNYVVNGTGSASSLWGLETPANSVYSVNNWQEEKKTVHFSLANPFGTCLWHFVYPGILSQYQDVSLDEFQKIMVAIAPVLGILSVVTTIMDIVNVIGPETGVGEIVAIILDVLTTVLGYVMSCPHQSKVTPNTIYYDFDLNEVSPLPAQFKRVEVTESPGTIGKTVETFTDGDPNDPGGVPDYALWDAAGNNKAFTPKQRFAPWAYGLPKLTTVYDALGNKIKETENVYDFTYAMEYLTYGEPCLSSHCIYPPQINSCKCQVINNYSDRSDNWSNATLYNALQNYTAAPGNADMTVEIYSVYSGRVQLKTTYERVYRVTDGTQYVQTETDYYYNGPHYVSPNCTGVGNNCSISNYDVNLIATKQSNGDVNYKSIQYTSDFNTGLLATLVSKNILSLPVATSDYVVKPGGTKLYLDEKVTEFAQVATSDIKSLRTLEQRFASPVSALTAYSGPTTTNYALYKIPKTFSYDANGNLIGMQDEGGRAITNIYDYNDKYIIATVINAVPTDRPAYTSFESGDLSRSGWGYSGPAPTYSTTSYSTGTRGLNLTTGTLYTSFSLNTAKAYILSFWASNSSVVVSAGATLAKSAPTYNGMTYYEYNVAAGTTSVSLTGNSTIDELRLYPANAKMRTVAYDPLIGKITDADENSRITYYTYDNLGRMQFMEDESRNIVKMYEYNNVSSAKQSGCPVTYSSLSLSELVARTNCTAGYQGSSVTFTIPAAQYTSTISQLDADIKAEIYFLTNAPGYANANGSCLFIYHNVTVSETDTTRSCAPGYTGGAVTYTVLAGTYSSVVSQADANQQAYDDTAANAQAYFNSPFTGTCTISTAADWEWFAGDSTAPADSSYCYSVGGALPPHLFVLATDVNPNSPTYNQKQYYDYGPNAACPANTYFNAVKSQPFTKACGTGYTGTTVVYTVPAGKYSSTASQAAADLQATNDISANGQAYANAHGACNVTIISGNLVGVMGWTAKFQGAQTYILNVLSNGTTMGSVPAGTYTITVSLPGNTTSYNFQMGGCGVVVTGTSATFSNVPISSGSCVYVDINPAGGGH